MLGPYWGLLLAMLVSPVDVEKACDAFQQGLKRLIERSADGSLFSSRACLICDNLLNHNENDLIKIKRLKALEHRLSGEKLIFKDLNEDLKEHYTYNGDGSEEWMKQLFLSPRACYVAEKKGFSCCATCAKSVNSKTEPKRVILPQYSIANGSLKGVPPFLLERLSDTELALMSLARLDKHVFTYYGGAHKSLRGWHTLYENDVDEIATALRQIQTGRFGEGKVVACVLQGPFTDAQKKAAQERTIIRPHFVIEGLEWLKRNNILYKHLKIPTIAELPKALIIDDTTPVESVNTGVETKFEYTVVFPSTENIRTTNGGFTSQAEFQANVVDAMDTTCDVTMMSRPTRNRLKDFEGDALLRAFPLQFPYGYGLPTEPDGKRKKKKWTKKLDQLSYLQNLISIAYPSFHRGDFLLVLHNIFERHRAVSVSYLRCINSLGDDSLGEHFASMTINQLKTAIARTESGMPNRDPVTSRFLNSVDAVCKSMGQTNASAKSARLHVFAETVKRGPGALFITVTPDDSNQFRIKVYAEGVSSSPPSLNADDATIRADYEVTVNLRQTYPGLCAFDFQQITDLFVEHILGWDKEKKCSKAQGGAFGHVEAFCAAIEEQGRKTLHGHWIVWLKDWPALLARLRNSSETIRDAAAQDLREYVDSISTTKLFQGSSSVIKKGYQHECTQSQPKIPTMCTEQDLRNLRYKHGQSSLGNENLFTCPDCEHKFGAQDLVDSVLEDWYGSSEIWEEKLRLAVKRYSSQIDDTSEVADQVRSDFVTQALCNLHRSQHMVSCFKKGCECRMKLPERPCDSTKVHFDDEEQMRWWTWTGIEHNFSPFLVESKRHKFDVFMNHYHERISGILGCNSNVQCGIDGGHMMYVTYYFSKSTQKEDKLAYSKVARTMYARIRRQEETTPNEEDASNAPTPFAEGYRRLLSAVLAHTGSDVVSAPMAWYLIKNGSRFIFSHESAYVGLEGFLGKKTTSTVHVKGNKKEQIPFLLNKCNDFVFRPEELEKTALYQFVAQFEVRRFNKENGDTFLKFTEDHGQRDFRGVVKRLEQVTPLVSYLDFADSSKFDGDILDTNVPPTPAMEKFARAALCLFVPFRDPLKFTMDPEGSWTAMFRKAFENNELSDESIKCLQNIQDCRNLLKAGRQKDMLERCTVPLPDPEGNKKKSDYDEATQAELDRYIDEELTELIAQMDEDDALLNPTGDALNHISLSELRKSGRNGCGMDAIPECVSGVTSNDPIYEFTHPHNEEQVESDPEGIILNSKSVTKEILTKLSISAKRRKVALIKAVEGITPDGTPTTIQRWGRLAFTNTETGVLDESQKRAFEVIASRFVLSFHADADANEGSSSSGTLQPRMRHNYILLKSELRKLSGTRGEDQLICFLTGAGGSGKTKVINTILAYAKGFCKEIGYVFDKRMIVVSAMTGVAATLINGETIHTAAHLFSDNIKADFIKEWQHTRLVIIDEISFATSSDLKTLNEKLGLLKEVVRAKYGGMHIVFTGDFSQLEPVGGNPLYFETRFALWYDWVNCFIELTGQHRFHNDPQFGAILKRIREGCPTEEDIAVLNTRVINGDHPDAPTMENLPNNLAYAVYENADRSAINNALFDEHIKATHSMDKEKPPPQHTVIIRSDQMFWGCNQRPMSRGARRTLWQYCSDSDVKTANSRPKFVDLFLKLYHQIPMMYTENSDVANGEANGTLCFLEKIVFFPGVSEDDFEMIDIDGYWVRMIDASKVDFLLCRFSGEDSKGEPRTDTFEVRADQLMCKINYPIQLIPGETSRRYVRALVNRFPVLTNHATTGHKLQGQTKDNILISAWHYGKNWPYVVLSRVRSLKGLFLRTKLDPKHDFSHDPRLTEMIRKMRHKSPVDYEQEQDEFANMF